MVAASGNLWWTIAMADRLVAITPQGDLVTLLEDGNPAASAELERYFRAGQITVDVLIAAKGTLAPWTSSVTFGGSDLRTVYIGSVFGATIPYFKAPVAGLPLTYAR